MLKRLCLLVVLVIASACGGDSSSSATPSTPAVNLSGNWRGSVSSVSRAAIVGVGTILTTLSQSGTSLTGTWSASYANPANNNSGSVTGAVTGASVSLTLSSSVPTACPFTATATLSGSTSMTGTYATFNCTVSDSGPFTLTKQ